MIRWQIGSPQRLPQQTQYDDKPDETGRHHQIRTQLAAIGCIIKGDLKYGAKRSNSDGSISLHARKISFSHPTTKEEITVIAPTPSGTIWDYFQ